MIWPRKAKTRRTEIRRQRTEAKPSAWRTFQAQYGIVPILIGLGLYVAATLIILSGGQTMPWQYGQYVPGDVRARVAFTVTDEKLTEDNRRKARLATPNVYVRNDALLTSIAGKVRELFVLAKSSEDAAKFIAGAQEKGWHVDEKDYAALKSLASEPSGSGAQLFEDRVNALTRFLSEQYVVEKVNDPTRPTAPEQSLLKWNTSGERRIFTSELQYVSDTNAVKRIAEEAARENLSGPLEPLIDDVSRLIVQSLQPDAEKKKFDPIYRYDALATAKLMDENERAVPKVVSSYNAGDVLVKGGTNITEEQLALLRHEHEAYRKALSTDWGLRRAYLLRRLGTAIIVLLVIAGLAIYTLSYQRRNVQKSTRALGLSTLLLGMLALARLIELSQWPALPTELVVAPVVMAAAILTIVYEQRYAFGVTGGLAILATLAVEGDFALFITLLVPMAMTVFLLKDLRTRGKLIATGAIAGVAAFVASLADGLISGQEITAYVLPHAGAAALAALLAGFIVLGVLPAIERLFGVATSLTLLEWCDANKPLLRRLAQEAPGTHIHSLTLGTIAEAAADAIGANGLLTRVGALYHDIGKIAKPEYYVENQEAKINRHDRLGPTLSLLVIVAHVKDGLELAREYGLPKVLHQFIAEHHGTTVVRYFQRMAAEQAQKSKLKELPESEFRYPGPKPRTRETAVLMICDGVEGAVRALPEPTPGRIETTVHQIVMERLNDGQFDDCDITLKDLSRVEEAVVKGLCAAYHGRIAYPKDVSKEAAPRAKANGEKKTAPIEAEVPEMAVATGTGGETPRQ
jgi:putative nucleotidyltransferase with HDIG domain